MGEESQKAVSRTKIEEALNACEAYFKREVGEADAAVQSAKYSAPERYISDMISIPPSAY